VTAPLTSVPLDEVTTALLDLFRGDVVEHAPRWVYDAAYDGKPTKPVYPHHILYRIPGGSSDVTPDLSGVRRTISVPWQLTTVGKYRNQCERAAQVAHDRLLARTLDGFVHPLAMPAGWACVDRRPDAVMPGITRSGDVPTAVFSLPARFYLTISRV
jgi:hypothetical protein